MLRTWEGQEERAWRGRMGTVRKRGGNREEGQERGGGESLGLLEPTPRLAGSPLTPSPAAGSTTAQGMPPSCLPPDWFPVVSVQPLVLVQPQLGHGLLRL